MRKSTISKNSSQNNTIWTSSKNTQKIKDMTNMNVIKEREMLYIQKHCLSEKHVYQTLPLNFGKNTPQVHLIITRE